MHSCFVAEGQGLKQPLKRLLALVLLLRVAEAGLICSPFSLNLQAESLREALQRMVKLQRERIDLLEVRGWCRK
jgi:hypothetical protein